MSPTPRQYALPFRVGSYELLRLVGEGSMGHVFEARHAKLDRTVAIKLLRAEQARDAGLVQRFFQEARTVNRINHPHIVEISDFVEDQDDAGNPRAWCVMEYLEGETLAAMLSRGALPIARAVQIADHVSRAVAAAHEVGVIHRDLKPENIFVTRGPDGADFAKVLDFGVAKLMQPDPAVHLTETQEGALVGTPRYMSPEQAAGLTVDPRADIYGVGCLLYEMISGQPPFDGTSFAHLMARIISAPPRPLPATSASGEEVPPELRTLVLQCLEKDPSARPQHLGELRERLGVHERSRRASRGAFPAALVAGAGMTALVISLVLFRPAVQAANAASGGELVPATSSMEPLPVEAPPRDVVVARAAPADGTEAAPIGAVTEDSSAQPGVAPASKAAQQNRPAAALRARHKKVAESRDAVLDPFQR